MQLLGVDVGVLYPTVTVLSWELPCWRIDGGIDSWTASVYQQSIFHLSRIRLEINQSTLLPSLPGRSWWVGKGVRLGLNS